MNDEVKKILDFVTEKEQRCQEEKVKSLNSGKRDEAMKWLIRAGTCYNIIAFIEDLQDGNDPYWGCEDDD